jgi:hypothetical protein
MDYLRRWGSELNRVLLAINIDDVGYKRVNQPTVLPMFPRTSAKAGLSLKV